MQPIETTEERFSNDGAATASDIDVVPRTPPQLTSDTEFYWRSGADGKLRVLRCQACGFYLHPPGPLCPECLSANVLATPVSGRGTVASYTINHHPWNPSVPLPYTIVLVELDEQPGLRLLSNLVSSSAFEPTIGMPVEVGFEEQADGVHIPVFSPCETP